VELPLVENMRRELADQPDLQIVAVEVNDDRTGAEKFIQENELGFIFAEADRDFVETWFATAGYPNSFLIGRDRRIRSHHLGFAPEMAPVIRRELLDELRKRSDVAGGAVARGGGAAGRRALQDSGGR
jgi:hypothetical protein